jgi:two-component system response regulator HydG
MARDIIVLVVDDEHDHADGIAEALQNCCAKAIAVYSGEDALEFLRSEVVNVVVTDLKLGGDIDGMEILEEAKKYNADTEVILITAYATIDTCKEAIRRGAYDYLVKPIDIGQLRTLVEQAARKISAATRRRTEVAKAGRGDFEFEGIRGKTAAIQGIFEVLRRVAPTDISVLIEGRSGTGKELLARAIHYNSKRADRPFRPVNCAGLTETLLESELFGHVKGAFTGAAADRKGLFEIADKGTLFLDEIGDMAMSCQAKLLRVIEDGVVIPVGSNKSIVVDVRIISATNQDLTALVDQKKFRQDLYFRIKGVSVSLPDLSGRAEDMPDFIQHFIAEAVSETGSKVTGITPAAVNILTAFNWPGNIRQLRNCIRTMVVMCDHEKLDVADIPPEIYQVRQLTAGRAKQDLTLSELERRAIIDTLARTGSNRQVAAKILGIGERTLYRKIKEYNL